jgi:aminoglycoside 6'-N-acetyltransferase
MGAITPSGRSSKRPTRPSNDPSAGEVLARDGELSIRLMRDDPADYERMSRWLNDEVVKGFWHGATESFPMRRILEKYGPRVRGEAPATPCFLCVDDDPIGYLQFYRTDDWPEWRDVIGLEASADRWALDVVIGEPERWNQGLGTRAVKSLLRYLFEERGAVEVVLTPLADNSRAIRSYEKAGFRKERLVPKGEFHDGTWRDAWLMSASPEGGS